MNEWILGRACRDVVTFGTYAIAVPLAETIAQRACSIPSFHNCNPITEKAYKMRVITKKARPTIGRVSMMSATSILRPPT